MDIDTLLNVVLVVFAHKSGKIETLRREVMMKLLASDYDGTLRINKRVDEDEKKAIKAFRKQGNLFVLVTGRSIESIREEVAINQFEFDYIIGNNGGVVYDHNFTKMKENFIDFNAATACVEYIKTVNCIAYVLNNGVQRSKTVVNTKANDSKYGYMAASISEEEIRKEKKIAQIVISLENNNESHDIAAYINENFKDYINAYVNVNCIDIVPNGVSKATGLTYLIDKIGFDEKQVYSIGDSYNDISMISYFHGFCMESSPDEIQKIAKNEFKSVGNCIKYIME
ncbi:MAG: HAD-IIB family hydrolase [Erysipelotrichaceae bacterium]